MIHEKLPPWKIAPWKIAPDPNSNSNPNSNQGGNHLRGNLPGAVLRRGSFPVKLDVTDMQIKE